MTNNVQPEEVQRILKKRAAALARPLEGREPPAESTELLVFSLTGRQYAVEVAHVCDVVRLPDITPLPCTPFFVVGVVNHRGRILAVLNLRRLLGLAGEGIPESASLVTAEAGGMRFGILADHVAGTVRVDVRDIGPPPVTCTDDEKAWLRGVTREMVALLDLEALVLTRRIVVHDEVS